MERLIKSIRRVKTYGEVFTPEIIVSDMLDLISKKYNCKVGFDLGSLPLDITFLEPSCGNGNFLVQILARKLRSVKLESLEEDMFIALSTIYGVDIQDDNVLESRERLLNICQSVYSMLSSKDMSNNYAEILANILESNIVLGNTLYEGVQKFEIDSFGNVVPLKVPQKYMGGMIHLSNSGELIKSKIISDSEVYERMYFYKWSWGSTIKKVKSYFNEDNNDSTVKPLKTKEDYFSKFASML